MIIGIILALLSGISLGGITSFAALSYQFGAEPIALIALRGSIAAIAMTVITLSVGSPLWPGRAALRHIFIMGAFLSMTGFGLMAAVAFISPGLAVAILCLYPIIVLVVDSLRTRTIPQPLTMTGFGLALVGISLCLGAADSLADINIMGLALALMAACGMAGYILTSAAVQRGGYGHGVLIWANGIVFALAILLIPIFTDNIMTALPSGGTGWIAFVMAASLYTCGIVFSFLALRRVMAPTVALMMNVEPLTTLLAAHLLVGEVLMPLQYSGMIMAVIGIIIGSQSINKKAA